MSPIVLIVLIGAAGLLWISLRPAGFSLGRRPAGKRCERCWRSVDRVQPYIDGRREFWVCTMCAAEMDIANARHLDVPRG